MKLTLPFDEALALATSGAALPVMLDDVRCEGSTIHTEVDLTQIETTAFAKQLAFAAAGTVTVTARFLGFTSGVVSFAITAHARGLPAHKLVPYLLDPINRGLNESGMPPGLVELERGESEPVVLIDLQKAVDSRMAGMTITAFDLADSTLVLEAVVEAAVSER
ncbi:hypothetical protein [Marisediminicola sp. LYQ134]|uniref:hypothetical protein n=1 Tax=unclassified Marisediminicola TaxID=2618316 RepID=UPI0039833D2D